MHTWRASYYDNAEDEQPSQIKTFQAQDVEAAVKEALGFKSAWTRVDLTITISRDQK